MTGTKSMDTATMSPLPKHSWSLKYLRLRAIAIFIHILTRSLLTLGMYFRDPEYLRRYQVNRKRMLVPSREKGRMIKVDVYAPNKGTSKPSPVHVNWHGSGFVVPCFGADTEICAYLASHLGCIVLDADYRKAPQNPFPAAPQDALDVCLYVLAHPELYDLKKISLGGCSAGGSIALAAAASLGPEKINAVCTIAPATDFRMQSGPRKARDAGRHRSALPPWATRFFGVCYVTPQTDRADPLLSVVLAPTSSFPNTVYIATGTGDTLYFDASNLIEKLRSEKHPNAQFRPVEGAGHAFEKFNTQDPNNIAFVIFQEIISTIRGSWNANRGNGPKL